VEGRSLSFYLPSVDASYDPVPTHPRFKAVLRRINLDGAVR
jgi:hypothetical protein